MTELTDQQLLSDYAERRSEPAFTELVRRHIDHVHSVASRITGEVHSARDVTQHVFVALAQNAPRLARHPVLSGWLHTTARNLAAKTVRAAVCRQHHEQNAAAMNEWLSTPADTAWGEIAPHLEIALGQLNEPDRNAVLLRYFERKSATEMAKSLGVSEEAAQKRVSRAVEKLRGFFSKQKITVGADGLTVLISANAVQSAPGGLAAAISAAALAGAAATKTIAMTVVQKSLITVTVAVLAGSGIYQARQTAQLRDQVRVLQQEHAQLRDKLQSLQQERTQLDEQVRSLQQLQAPLAEQIRQLQQLQHELGSGTNPSTRTKTESGTLKSE